MSTKSQPTEDKTKYKKKTVYDTYSRKIISTDIILLDITFVRMIIFSHSNFYIK